MVMGIETETETVIVTVIETVTMSVNVTVIVTVIEIGMKMRSVDTTDIVAIGMMMKQTEMTKIETVSDADVTEMMMTMSPDPRIRTITTTIDPIETVTCPSRLDLAKPWWLMFFFIDKSIVGGICCIMGVLYQTAFWVAQRWYFGKHGRY